MDNNGWAMKCKLPCIFSTLHTPHVCMYRVYRAGLLFQSVSKLQNTCQTGNSKGISNNANINMYTLQSQGGHCCYFKLFPNMVLLASASFPGVNLRTHCFSLVPRPRGRRRLSPPTWPGRWRLSPPTRPGNEANVGPTLWSHVQFNTLYKPWLVNAQTSFWCYSTQKAHKVCLQNFPTWVKRRGYWDKNYYPPFLSKRRRRCHRNTATHCARAAKAGSSRGRGWGLTCENQIVP